MLSVETSSWLLGLFVLTVGIIVPLAAVARQNKLLGAPRSKRSS